MRPFNLEWEREKMKNLTFDRKLTLIDYFKYDTIKVIWLEILLTQASHLHFSLCHLKSRNVIFDSFNDFFVHNLHLIAVYSTHKERWFNYIKLMEKYIIYQFWQKIATKWLYLSFKNKEYLYFYLEKIFRLKTILWKESIHFPYLPI